MKYHDQVTLSTYDTERKQNMDAIHFGISMAMLKVH